MCVLNRLGTAALGQSTISIGAPNVGPAVVPPAFKGIIAGNPRWLNDSVLICQAQINGQFVLVTWEWTPDLSKPLVGCDARGQNFLFAGGSRWAAQLNSPTYRDSFGASNSSWFPLAVDQLTGLIAIWDDVSQSCSVWGGANLSPVTSQPIFAGPCFKDGTLLYRRTDQNFGAWPALSVPPSQVRPAGNQFNAWHSQAWRLGYFDGFGLVVYAWAQTQGLQLHKPGDDLDHDFNPDIQAMPDGTIQVVSAKTEGEAPSDLQRYVVNMAARTVNGQSRAWVNLA